MIYFANYNFTTGSAAGTDLTALSAQIGGPFIKHTSFGSGSITITEISKKYIKGSFEFTAVRNSPSTSRTITNGEFSIARN